MGNPFLVTVAEMQELEHRADAGGHSYATMMELAGKSVAEVILRPSPPFPLSPSPCLLLVGPGNNGGDGLVCARYLHEMAITARVYLWKRQTDPAHDYEQHLAKLAALGIPIQHADSDPDLAQLRGWLSESSIVVDALLGTGANRAVEGQLAAILDLVGEQVKARRQGDSPLHVVAVDCPSGLNCDTGAVDPHTLPADLTVTFAHAKVGHYLFPGAELCGEIVVTDIGIAPDLSAGLKTFVLSAEMVQPWLPQRPRLSHKGTFGKLMAAVGCVNYPGAAYLSLAAAGRVGAGLVTGAVAQPVWSIAAAKLVESTWLPLPHSDGFLNSDAADKLVTSLEGYNVLLLGCGLGNTDATREFVARLLAELRVTSYELRMVVDADGLNIVAQMSDWHTALPMHSVITPHPAEMSRLCNISVKEVTDNRWQLARQKAAEWQCVVLLKGPYTVIADPDGRLAVLPIATPALATAGTGDVLAGTIAGLMTQGVESFQAACLGSWLHGQAGLRCEAEIGRAGVLASDVLGRLMTR
ncbi:MAG: NAD(P)H-hydrate dehydratase [Caldilineaceae bacterium]